MENKNHVLKRVLACVMVVIMSLTAVPLSGFVGIELPKWSEMFATRASAASEGYYTYTVSNGEATITNCNKSISGAVVIPDTLGGYPVTSIGNYAFNVCSGLTSITIPDSVTSIGEYAFEDCTGLTKIFWNAESVSDFYSLANPFYNAGTAGAGMDIIFGDSVKSIPAYAFYVSDSSYNPKIKSVTIGNSVTSIGYSAFEGCTGLTSVTIPDSVTSIGYSAFEGCTGLTSITIPDSVTNIGSSAFAGTAWYKAQRFGDVYAGKIYYKYKGTMPSNTSIVIKDGTKGIAGSAFYDCSGLTSITIPDSVTIIGSSAFYDCSGLTSITIPDSVTSIGSSAFYDCSGLTSITIPDSVTNIGGSAFSGCFGLTSITIPDSVKSIGSSAFYDCSGLTNIIIPDSVTIVGKDAFYDCNCLKSVTIGNGVERISKATFENCPLTTIKIGRNVKTIEENAFNGIKSIPEVYYAGSESDWKSISIDQTNDMILRATMHYNVDITHTHSYTSKITKAATCIENGTKTFTCDCGKTYTETIPATGHKSSSWITDKAATCVNDGSKHKECTVCKEILATEELTATGHSFKKEVTAATCVSLGFETKTCLNCSECQFVRVIPAKGHTPSGWKIDNDKGIRFKECTVCSSLLEAEKLDSCTHRFVSEVTDPTCTANGFETKTCSTCGECLFVRVIPATGHSLVTAVTPATQTESGISVTSCKTCAAITKATLIKRIASVSLSKTAFTYNGKVQTPTVTVKDSSGKVLKNGTDYKVKYSSGRKNPGQYSVTVTFKGNYSGKKPLTFTIVPAAPTLSVTAGAKKATLKWNKQTGATGYIVYMATSKSGKFSKIATLKGNSKISYTKTGLTKGKTYYFKVCAYTTAGGKNINGTFSAVKSVKVK